MAKPIIFISHISKEAELAEILKNNLTKDFLNMIEVFVSSDGASIRLGKKWLEELDMALKGAQIEIILCSKDSVLRPWVNFEAGAGWVRGISVIPVCHTDIKLTELPIPLNLLQGIVASDASGLQELYAVVAEKLGGAVPKTDFPAIVNEIKDVEKKYNDEKLARMQELGVAPATGEFPTVKRILKPKILCATSSQFEALGFEQDLATIESYFPGQVTAAKNITAKGLRHLLSEHKFDMLHLLAYIGKNGDLIFSDHDPNNEKATRTLDFISAEGFAKLIELSKISLVLLATCDSLPLAASLNRKTNLIAAMDTINIDEIIGWEDCFYGFLSKGFSVEKSYELTKSLHVLPMLLIPATDIAFAPER